MNERHSDLGTFEQLQMRNRVLLGDDRGEQKKTYVVSNLDICFDNDIIDEWQREAGKIYWAWRTVARKAQGYGSNPAYGETLSKEPCDATDALTEDGAITEMFIILRGLISPDNLSAIDACCNEADPNHPLMIIQAFQCRIGAITHAFVNLDEMIIQARKVFEERVQKVLAWQNEHA